MLRRSFIKTAVIFAIFGILLVWFWSSGFGVTPQSKRASSGANGSAERENARPPGSPEVQPVLYKAVTPQSATAINAAVPLVSVGPAAAPFRIELGTVAGQRAVRCLAQAIYYEARSEPMEGQQAVAQIVLNRVRSPAFPASICSVVYQGFERSTGCQFTFTCDGSLRRDPDGAAWQRARRLAAAALSGRVHAAIGYATHYHANYVVPYWAASMAKVRVIGSHDFYRWPGRWRPAKYFSQTYRRSEPDLPQSLTAPAVAYAQQELADVARLNQADGPGNLSLPKGESMLAIDQSSHTLIGEGKIPQLDPKLNQWKPPQADYDTHKLTPRQ